MFSSPLDLDLIKFILKKFILGMAKIENLRKQERPPTSDKEGSAVSSKLPEQSGAYKER